jgi:hypothetical protein
MKIPTNNEAAKKTQTQISRIKNEIKFVYKKKQQVNTQLYHTHILNTKTWQQIWSNIEQSINQKLHKKWKKYTQKTQLN